MLKQKQSGNRRICNVLQVSFRRVAGVRSMQRNRRYGGLLAAFRAKLSSGTVVPQCDFHCNTLEMPLNKGDPASFASRTWAPACTHAQEEPISCPQEPRILILSIIYHLEKIWLTETQN